MDRVLRMNEATSDHTVGIPFPALQQLGYPDALRHKRDRIRELDPANPDGPTGHGLIQMQSRVRMEPPVIGPATPPDEGTDPARSLQRDVPGRNKRAISASQSSSAVTQDLTEQTTLESRGRGASGDTGVPDGTIDDVLSWVGDDPNRARVAIETEKTRPSPRKSLIAQLNDKI
jgi:hypothetical protein